MVVFLCDDVLDCSKLDCDVVIEEVGDVEEGLM